MGEFAKGESFLNLRKNGRIQEILFYRFTTFIRKNNVLMINLMLTSHSLIITTDEACHALPQLCGPRVDFNT